ncbi:adenylate/guanylate cyclase domain-containing protein [Spongiimicrobium sp. 3-5]|uniref:adenylate/guanylate cyclase domain-containing protein n=1 Tax=Spongiimicrobium sp. 3-5 TaxID=3332596 RepID=UPI0039802F46
MKENLKEFLRLLFAAIVFWSFVFCFFILIRYYAINQEQGLILDRDFDVSITQWLDFGVFLGIFIGFFYALIEFLFDKYLIKKLYLGLSIIIRTIIYLIVLIASLTMIMDVAEVRMDLDLPNEKGWWRTNKVFWLTVLYFGIFSLVFSFLKIVNEKFGKGVFFKLLIGRYRKPREEDKVFMFLDLRSSTTIAETLGHFKYSQLIQDCFLDLNSTLNRHFAEVYQYVGDEAVVSWDFKKAIKNNNCIALFFAFQDRIQKRSGYYLKKYDTVPEFKAGVHGGKLIVVEVGSIKKELAYHGDVINTAARIQDQCNVYNEKLLVSQQLLQKLSLSPSFTHKIIGDLMLKGKSVSLSISAIKRA